MRPRDLVLVGAAALLASVIAIPLLGNPTQASELPRPLPTAPEGETAPTTTEALGGTAQLSAVAFADPVFRKSEQVSTTGWTSGVIRGDIALSTSILDEIQTLQVVIDELRPAGNDGGPRPFRFVQRVDIGVGTPTFTIRNIPFSAYGYVVSAYAAGLNGNQMTVEISAEHPLVEDVQLAIMPGAPFSLLLRDQESNPITATEVRLIPSGSPLGRPQQHKQTDNFGSAVFQNLLAGDYQVAVGPTHAPLMEPQVPTVQSSGMTLRNGVPQPQGTTLVVPAGVPVEIVVTDSYGSPLANAAVRMQATDRKQLTMLDGVTDIRGHLRFARVAQGLWQIDVHKPDHDRRVSQLSLDGKQTPPDQLFQLPRLR